MTNNPDSLNVLAKKIKQFFDLHSSEPISGFMPEDLAKFIVGDAVLPQSGNLPVFSTNYTNSPVSIHSGGESIQTSTLIGKLQALKAPNLPLNFDSLVKPKPVYNRAVEDCINIVREHVPSEISVGFDEWCASVKDCGHEVQPNSATARQRKLGWDAAMATKRESSDQVESIFKILMKELHNKCDMEQLRSIAYTIAEGKNGNS